MHNDELDLRAARRAAGAILIGLLILGVCIVGVILLAIFHDVAWAPAIIFLLLPVGLLGFLLLEQLDAEDEAKAKIQRRLGKEAERILREEDRAATGPDYVWVVTVNDGDLTGRVVTVVRSEEEARYYNIPRYRVVRWKL